MVVDDGAGLPPLPDDPRVFGVSLSRNCGIPGIVRNVGIRLTLSKYLAFLDDDNTWKSQHLSQAIAALEGGAEMVYTAVRRHTPDGAEFDVLSRAWDRKAFSDQSSFVDTNAIVLGRGQGRLFSRLPRVRTTLPREDWEYVYRVSRGLRVEHLPVATVEYLVNPESNFTNWSEGPSSKSGT
jgi:glycosyltransferase involved in cell wall biosynthesis